VWKQLLEFGRQLFMLASKVQKLEEDMKELRQGLKEVREDIEELRKEGAQTVQVLQRLVWELERDRGMAAQQHENLVLRLENALLRSERHLPAASSPDEPNTEQS
jgi:chromosome segregation ATPase